MDISQFKSVFSQVLNTGLSTRQDVQDTHDLLIGFRDEIGFSDPDNRQYALKISNYARDMAQYNARMTGDGDFDDLYWRFLLFEAPEQFESYLYYMEKNRQSQKKFYYPRRKTLKTIVSDLQDLEDREIEYLGVSLPPRTGKSTLCIFFLSWIMGKRPNSHNAMSGHSGILADGFYGEIQNLIDTQEYTWHEIFPGIKTQKKSADKKEINLDKPDRFPTLTCRGIDGTWTGAVDISSDGYLYVDDLVRDRMESLSPERLENRYQDYLNVLVDRKNDGSRELAVGTRWNVMDYLTRTENEYRFNPKYRFRKIPALNEDDESNFDYEYNLGFTSDYYIKMRERLDRPEWMAKFQQAPYVREGLLFPDEELRFFDGVIPDGDYTVVASCDPAFGGGDSASMPICLAHENGNKYIIDWVHDKRTVKYTVPKICDMIQKYNITELRFEKNNGGALFMEDVKEEFQNRGYFHCKCYEKAAPVKIHKEDKIKAYADWIKDNFIFLMPNKGITADGAFKRTDDYQKALMETEMFTAEGKNSSDDAPDALTQLAMIFENKFATPPTRIIKSPL